MKYKLALISLVLVSVLAVSACGLPGLPSLPTQAPLPSPTTVTQTNPSSSPSPAPVSQKSPLPVVAPALPSAVLSASASDLESLVESIYASVNPSVVNIQVILKQQTSFPNIPGLQITPNQPQLSSALGSGFVWDAAGRIVTNNHVVSGAQSISVTFYEGTIVTAKLVGADPDSDLAVIQVDAPASLLQPVQLGDSSKLKVGQLAVAIGNPFGLQSTLTVGFVSGLGRILPANESALGPSYSIPDIIQTDASINPGNSGGVLLNSSGQVIGVTAAIASQSGSSAGVGFAIPASIVQQVVPVLIKDGHFDHPWLGVSIATLTPDIVNSMNLKSGQRGAMVQQVVANSPAEKAGLQPSQKQVTINGVQIKVGGDVITALGSQVVKSSDDLIAFLSESGSIGQTVTLTVIRNGQEIKVPVTLAARPAS